MNATAVVRIYCTSQNPDYDAPWQAQTPSSSTGSGVVLPCGRIPERPPASGLAAPVYA